MMHKRAHCFDEAANHQFSIAAAFWIIQIVSAEECSSLSQSFLQICCSTCSFWTQWPQYTCSLNGTHCLHWLVQWSHHCSHMHISFHPPWLSGYISVVQTVLIILTMAGLFPDILQLISIIIISYRGFSLLCKPPMLCLFIFPPQPLSLATTNFILLYV